MPPCAGVACEQAQRFPVVVTVARIVMVIRIGQYSRTDTWPTCDTRQHDQGKYNYIDGLPDYIAAIYLEQDEQLWTRDKTNTHQYTVAQHGLE